MKSQVTLLHLNTEVSIPKTKHVPIATFLKYQDTDQGRPQEKMRASMDGKKTCPPSSTAHLRWVLRLPKTEKLHPCALHMLLHSSSSKAATRFVG